MKECPQITLKKTNTGLKAVQISKSTDAATFMRNFYGDDLELYESMFMILLNRRNITIGWVKLGQGGITGTVCDPRIIGKYCLEAMATGVIICHNHPSGNTRPSNADEELTKKLKEGLTYIDCILQDHIILTADSHFSFADEGYL